jgi:hypothetical protein
MPISGKSKIGASFPTLNILSRGRRGCDDQFEQATMMTRDNILYLVIGALVVAVAVLGYQLYEAKKEPSGLHINLGEKGLSIEGK